MMNSGFKFANLNDTLVYVRVGNGFVSRRGYKEQIDGFQVIQDYMLTNGMISKRESRWNMFCVKAFVNAPAWVKKILYALFLRK